MSSWHFLILLRVQFSSVQLSSDISVILFSSDGKLCDDYWPRNVYVLEPKFRDLQGQEERQHAD
uniref:Secreted protein n=1 Tax=Arundo donax TaxID=35708 RepID=A0A0A9CRP3_ARUDO